jgi:hypothetical protein
MSELAFEISRYEEPTSPLIESSEFSLALPDSGVHRICDAESDDETIGMRKGDTNRFPLKEKFN